MSDLMLQEEVYVDTKTVETVWTNPWMNTVPVIGTDGFQFSSSLTTEYVPTVFVPSISRPLSFSYTGMDSNSYKGLTLYTYQMEATQLNNATETPTNEVYDIWVTGTTNLTSTLGLPAFASKPLFYGVNSNAVQGSIPKMFDQSGNPISGSADNESVFSVEQLSGLTLKSQTNLQYNFNLKNDYLVTLQNNNSGYGMFLPLVWIQRSADLGQSTVQSLLGGIESANSTKWIVFGIMLGVGVIVLGVGVFMVVKAKMVASQNGGAAGGEMQPNADQEALVGDIPRDSTKVGPAIRINLSEKVTGDRDTDIEDQAYRLSEQK